MEYYGGLAAALGLGYAVSGNIEFKVHFFVAFAILSVLSYETHLSLFKLKLKIFETYFELFKGRRFIARIDFSDIQSCSLYKIVKNQGRFGKSVKYLANMFTRSGFTEFHGREEYFKLKEIVGQSCGIRSNPDSDSFFGKLKVEGYSEIVNQFIDGFKITQGNN